MRSSTHHLQHLPETQPKRRLFRRKRRQPIIERVECVLEHQ
jgi:hypothetical protein